MSPAARLACAFALSVLLMVTGCASTSDESADGADLFSGLAPDTDDPELMVARENFQNAIPIQLAETAAAARVMTDAIRAGDLNAARKAYGPSRQEWMAIHVFAPLLMEDPTTLDPSVDQFDGPTDPDFTGWHRIEYHLFVEGDTVAAVPFADRLDADLALLQAGGNERIAPGALPAAAAALATYAVDVSLYGGVNRWSKADIYDFRGGLDGARSLFLYLGGKLTTIDEDLRGSLELLYFDIDQAMNPWRGNNEWLPYCLPDDPFPPGVCAIEEPTQPEEFLDLHAKAEEFRDGMIEMRDDLGIS